MPFVKWNDPSLSGFRVYKLNERLCLDHTDPQTHGFIVFRSYYRSVKHIAPFSFQDLRVLPSSSSPFPAFSSALFSSAFFWPEDRPNYIYTISKQITLLLHLFYKFSHETAFHLTSPTLVFVLDFIYTPTLFPGCRDNCHLFNDPNVICESVTSFQKQCQLQLTGSQESIALGNTTWLDEDYDWDVDGEVVDIITQLRDFCGVGAEYEPVRVCDGVPAGLSEVTGPMVVNLEEKVEELCPLCGKGFEQWEDSVLIHGCGHVSHTHCALRVLTDTKCFVCGLGEVTIL